MKLQGVAIALALSLAASTSRAQTLELFGRDRSRGRYESPQNFALEVRGGPWYPNVDAEFGGRASPFADMFGASDRALLSLEIDWQALRINYLGSIGIGVGAGYTAAGGVAPITQTPMPADPAEWNRPNGGQETALAVIPMYAVGVLRLDVIARRTVVPLVPYVKFGLAYDYWWITNGDVLARRSVGLSPGANINDPDIEAGATGGTLGTHLALGMMLRLDFLEPRAARAWDLQMGVNHSYLFFEYVRHDASGIGSRPQLRLDYESWATGLAFEF